MDRTYRKDRREDESEARSGNWVLSSLLMGVVSLMAGAAGFVLPHVINTGALTKLVLESPGSRHEARNKARNKATGQQPVFVPFGDVVVNLAEERLTRHLQVRITLLVLGADAPLVEETLENNKALLMNWLISYLSDKSLDEVRGAAGMNQARREIQDHFNQLLFADGSEKVRDVLFEEFTVQ